MKNQINCHSCNKPIKSKNDLITALYLVFIRPYHSSCYANKLKSLKTIFLKNYPINGISGTLGAILVPIIGLYVISIFLKTKQIIPSYQVMISAIFFFIFLIVLPIFIRLYSYYKYEKPLSR